MTGRPRPSAMNRARLIELAEELEVDAVYLERDFILTEIIRHYATSELGDSLVLKGGQALRHVHGSPRFSKDADYIATRRIEFEDLRDALAIDYPRITLPEHPEGGTRRAMNIRPIKYRGPLGLPSTVEIEVSFRGDLVLEPTRVHYESPFGEPFDVLVMDLNEMVAEKIRALYQRGHPRDLYDLWFVFTTLGPSVDPQTVSDVVPDKFRPGLDKDGWSVARSRLFDRIRTNERQWDELLRGFVLDSPTFDQALSVVERALRFLREVRPPRR